MSAPDDTVAVLEIGGTHVTAALVDVERRRLRDGTINTESLDADGPADRLIAAFASAANRLAAGPGCPWGIAIPGPFDYERGVALFADVGKFDSLNGVDLRQALSTGITPAPGLITFVNDADAFLLGEWADGAATGHRRSAALTLGTGIGSAFLADGTLVTDGPDVPPGGRAHHLRIRGRPLEDVVSRRAIRRRYAEATGHDLDVREIAHLSRAGDRTASEIIEAAFCDLGSAMGPCLARFEATALVIGGSMATSWDLIGPPLRRGLLTGGLGAGVLISPAVRPTRAPLLGAAYAAGGG